MLDVFRVVGGSRHTRHFGSHFGTVTTAGLSLASALKPPRGTQTRKWRVDPAPRTPWSVTWDVEERYGYLPKGAEVHLRLTDLTSGASAGVGEAWVVAGLYDSDEQVWVPRVMVMRSAAKPPLTSTFVGVIEPYGKTPAISGVRRLPLTTADGKPYGDANVAVEIALADGRTDLIVAADVENPLGLKPAAAGHVIAQKDWRLRLNGQLCLIRRDKAARPVRIALCRAKGVRIGGTTVRLRKTTDYVELRLDGKTWRVVAGDADNVDSISTGD